MSRRCCLALFVLSVGCGSAVGQAGNDGKAAGSVASYAGKWRSAPAIDRALGHNDRKRGGFFVPLEIEIAIDEALNKEFAAELREAHDPHMAGHRLVATGRFRRNEEKASQACAITHHDGATYLWHAFPFAPARAKLWLVPGTTRESDLLFVEWFSYPRAERAVSALQR